MYYVGIISSEQILYFIITNTNSAGYTLCWIKKNLQNIMQELIIIGTFAYTNSTEFSSPFDENVADVSCSLIFHRVSVECLDGSIN